MFFGRFFTGAKFKGNDYIKGTLKTGKLPSLGSVLIGDRKTKIKDFSVGFTASLPLLQWLK